MPTYQYICNDCGHEFEEFQSISALPLTECPKCGGHVERVISGGAGFLFKGSGFYITDYRSKGYKEAAQKDVSGGSSSSADSSSNSGSKSDSGSSSGSSESKKSDSGAKSSDK